MSMWSGKISSQRNRSPRVLSNKLPSNISFVDGKYYRKNKDGTKTELKMKKMSLNQFLKK